MLPKLTVDGRLVADPELRFGQSGTAVCKMRLVAADRRRDDQTGEWSDADTLWLDVTCFGKLAENVVESAVKGDLVLVHGKLKTDEWSDRETGQKRSKITMIADSVGVSLQFRTLPHGGQPQRAKAPAPVEKAYGYGQDADPPF